MGKKFEPARIRTRVPARKWKSKAEVEAWARQLLAGGPPKITAIVPQGHPEEGERATWKHLQDGVFENQFVVLESDPPGLIVHDLESGERKFVPSASKTGLVLGKTKAEEFISSIDIERELRSFAKSENDLFNKLRHVESELGPSGWTLEWYNHGGRIRQFVQSHPGISTEHVWRELVKWGRGQNGYSRQTHQDATYFHDWLGDVSRHHAVFQFATTRIQHILWADRTKEGRDSLLDAIVSGPLRGLSDDEFAWVVGKRKKNWPLEPEDQADLVALGGRIMARAPLSDEDQARLVTILEQIRDTAQTQTVRSENRL